MGGSRCWRPLRLSRMRAFTQVQAGDSHELQSRGAASRLAQQQMLLPKQRSGGHSAVQQPLREIASTAATTTNKRNQLLKERMAFISRRSTKHHEEKRGRSEEEAQMAPKGRNSELATRLWQSMPVECSAGMVRSNAITMGRRLERMFIF